MSKTSVELYNEVSESIGEQEAIKLYKSKWWEGLPLKEVAIRQFKTEELIMPFGEFHKAVEASAGRPVFMHEFALRPYELWLEVNGASDRATFGEVMGCIDKPVIPIVLE
jgi:hypothetical protein